MTSPEGRGSSAGGEATLAAFSGSRSLTRRRASSPASQTLAGPFPATIYVDTPSPPHDPPSPTGLARPVVTKVSRKDLFGEASSDSYGAISLSHAPRASVNPVLLPADYGSLPPIKVPRDQWIPGHRDRVPRSSAHVSARRVSWTSVAELDVDLLFRHFSRPK